MQETPRKRSEAVTRERGIGYMMAFDFSTGIRLKPHYAVHVAGEARTYLFSETGAIVLHGKVFARLLPLIKSGGATIEGIVRTTGGDIAPEYILFAIDTLLEEQLVTAEPGVTGDAGAAYWWQLDTSPTRAGANIAGCSVRVECVGLPGEFSERLGAILRAQGFGARSDDSSLAVLLVDDYLNRDLPAAIARLDSRKTPWIVMKPMGGETWFGPSSASGEVCWSCVTTRLLGNRLGQHALPDDVSAATSPPPAMLPSQVDGALNLVAAYLARRIGAGGKPDIGGAIHVLDPGRLEIARHAVLADPACACGGGANAARQEIRLDQGNSWTRYENGYRLASVAETYARISGLVSPIAGLIPELSRSDQYPSSYIYYARHGHHIAQGLAGNRIAGKPSWACGKGTSDIEARVSCIAEAIERYSCGYFGNEPTVRARFGELDNAIHPERILLFSDAQYENRLASHASVNDFNWIPERFNPELPVDWRECRSLDGSGSAFIPAMLCYMNYPDADGHRFCRADSNGCATGNSMEEALLFGLFELIERDAVSIWWFNRIAAPRVDVASFRDHAVNRGMAALKAENRETVVLDITTDIGVWTFACVSWDATNLDRIYIGYGTHLEPTIAIRRSLNEVMQVASYVKENGAPRHTAMGDWLSTATVRNLPFLAGDAANVRPAEAYPHLATGNLVSDIGNCVARLGARGLGTYYVNMTRGRSLLPTVRVVVPGLRHFWPRFAPGRLYDVPVEMGWLDRRLREDELNRYFYPL